MRTLELESYGVMEMNQEELILTDGGGFWEDFGKIVALVGLGAAILFIGLSVAIAMGLSGGGGGGDFPDPSSTPPNL